jgi:hypothetical protein
MRMEKKRTKILFGLIFLIAATIPVFTQKQLNSSPQEAIENRIKIAGERLKAATELWNSTIQQNKSQKEQDAAQAEWQKSVDEINDLKKVQAALPAAGSTETSRYHGTGASSETNRSEIPESPSVNSNTVPTPLSGPLDLSGISKSNIKSSLDPVETSVKTISDRNSTLIPRSQNQRQIVDCENKGGIFDTRLCNLASRALEGQPVELDPTDTSLLFLIYSRVVSNSKVAPEDRVRNFLLNAEDSRTDKQVGADSNAKGTTSIVVKGGAPAIFNFAAENGAATRSISGTTVTFRINPAGFYDVLQNRSLNYLESFRNGFTAVPVNANGGDGSAFKYERKSWNYFRKLSMGLSFDTSRGQTTPTLVTNERQLSAFSLRYEFFNERDPRHPKYAEKFRSFFKAEGDALIKRITEVDGQVYASNRFKNPALRAWFEETNKQVKNLTNPTVPVVEAKIIERLDLLPFEAINADTSLLESFKTITDSYIGFVDKEKELLAEIAKAPIFTVEYTNNRDPIVPDTHNFNFIYEKGFPMGSAKDSPVIDVTLNGSLTFFNRKPINPSVKRIKEFNFAGQVDVPLGGVNPEATFFGTVFSFAGKYQRLNGNAVALDGTVLPNTKGDIWVGQLKLTIPLDRFGLTGIKFPISATFANRTELVRENEVRGNFGFTFDLDKLILKHFLNR